MREHATFRRDAEHAPAPGAVYVHDLANRIVVVVAGLQYA
jgi:hypothetical protein